MVTSEVVIWVMESDCCEMCNGLLDWFGCCPHCGWDPYFGYPDYEEKYVYREEENWGDGDDPFTDFGDYDDE